MNGWKAKTGGIGAILTGLGFIAAGLADDGGINYSRIAEGFLAVFGGLSVFGIRVAMDKLKDSIKEGQ